MTFGAVRNKDTAPTNVSLCVVSHDQRGIRTTANIPYSYLGILEDYSEQGQT